MTIEMIKAKLLPCKLFQSAIPIWITWKYLINFFLLNSYQFSFIDTEFGSLVKAELGKFYFWCRYNTLNAMYMLYES